MQDGLTPGVDFQHFYLGRWEKLVTTRYCSRGNREEVSQLRLRSFNVFVITYFGVWTKLISHVVYYYSEDEIKMKMWYISETPHCWKWNCFKFGKTKIANILQHCVWFNKKILKCRIWGVMLQYTACFLHNRRAVKACRLWEKPWQKRSLRGNDGDRGPNVRIKWWH